MQTSLDSEYLESAEGKIAESILRKCVHCGFCNATCPTYELLGNELDGPRGRIYQIKQLLEDGAANAEMRTHLDRCLLCRSCETTCPSGVEYGRLLEIGRATLDRKLPRPATERLQRKFWRDLIGSGRLFQAVVGIGIKARGLLPRSLAEKVPAESPQTGLDWPPARHARRMIALAGCAQPALAPNTNVAAARVLDGLGISLVEHDGAGCCGAVHLHTSDVDRGRQFARALIDAWLPLLDMGAEAVVMTASGCGVTVRDYPHLFADDPAYRERATRLAEHTFDLSEVIAREAGPGAFDGVTPRKVAVHLPCTLQHGQRITGRIETLLEAAGHRLVPVRDSHLCCGSAGTYSLFNPDIAGQLRDNKQAALMAGEPEVICTANVGCQSHLAVGATVPVRHWVELLLQEPVL